MTLLDTLPPRRLEAMKLASRLVESIRMLTKTFPESEDMCLVVTMREAVMQLHKAVMMTGAADDPEDFFAYTNDARGKGARLRCELQMAHQEGYVQDAHLEDLLCQLDALADLVEPPPKPSLTLVE